MIILPMLVRQCGECSACCKTHSVSSISKSNGQWCQHCNIGQGCLIYSERPSSCKNYACNWLLGNGEDSDRPDRLNMVVDQFNIVFKGKTITILDLWQVEGELMRQSQVEKIAKGHMNGKPTIIRYMPASIEPPYYCFPNNVMPDEDQEQFIEAFEAQRVEVVKNKP